MNSLDPFLISCFGTLVELADLGVSAFEGALLGCLRPLETHSPLVLSKAGPSAGPSGPGPSGPPGPAGPGEASPDPPQEARRFWAGQGRICVKNHHRVGHVDSTVVMEVEAR